MSCRWFVSIMRLMRLAPVLAVSILLACGDAPGASGSDARSPGSDLARVESFDGRTGATPDAIDAPTDSATGSGSVGTDGGPVGTDAGPVGTDDGPVGTDAGPVSSGAVHPIVTAGTSRTLTVEWDAIPGATAIRVFLAAEPSPHADEPMPGESLIATLAGDVSRYVVTGLNARATADTDAGADVKDIDLASMPPAEGVKYHVRLPGVGVSWRTEVSEQAVSREFSVWEMMGPYAEQFSTLVGPGMTPDQLARDKGIDQVD